MTAKTLYDKIWDAHVAHEAEDGTCLLYIDRHLVHEVTSPQAFEGLRTAGRPVRAPNRTLAVADHRRRKQQQHSNRAGKPFRQGRGLGEDALPLRMRRCERLAVNGRPWRGVDARSLLMLGDAYTLTRDHEGGANADRAARADGPARRDDESKRCLDGGRARCGRQ